jgi:hypothetical protein
MFRSDGMSAGELVVRPDERFNGIKVFSATMFAERSGLGEKVTDWIAANPHKKVTQFVLSQSSDAAFHCIAITVFYREELAR